MHPPSSPIYTNILHINTPTHITNWTSARWQSIYMMHIFLALLSKWTRGHFALSSGTDFLSKVLRPRTCTHCDLCVRSTHPANGQQLPTHFNYVTVKFWQTAQWCGWHETLFLTTLEITEYQWVRRTWWPDYFSYFFFCLNKGTGELKELEHQRLHCVVRKIIRHIYKEYENDQFEEIHNITYCCKAANKTCHCYKWRLKNRPSVNII